MTYSVTCLLAFFYNSNTHHIWSCTQPDGYSVFFYGAAITTGLV